MAVRDASFFEQQCARLSARPQLTEADEQALVRRWRERGQREAADALVEAHLPLVLHLANRLRGYGVSREELIGEGNVGLLRALDKFELRGVRFKTYATYWVRAYMLAYILRARNIVIHSTGAVGAKLFFKLRAARARAEALLGPGHEGIDARLAEQFGVGVDVIRTHTARLGLVDSSLDAPLSEDGDATLGERLAADDATPEERAAAVQRDERVRQTLDRLWRGLDPRERAVVTHRFLDDDVTLSELGARFDLSRERLRQIELRIKDRLKRALAEARH